MPSGRAWEIDLRVDPDGTRHGGPYLVGHGSAGIRLAILVAVLAFVTGGRGCGPGRYASASRHATRWLPHRGLREEHTTTRISGRCACTWVFAANGDWAEVPEATAGQTMPTRAGARALHGRRRSAVHHGGYTALVSDNQHHWRLEGDRLVTTFEHSDDPRTPISSRCSTDSRGYASRDQADDPRRRRSRRLPGDGPTAARARRLDGDRRGGRWSGGLAAAASLTPDVVLLDIGLPDVDRIRRRRTTCGSAGRAVDRPDLEPRSGDLSRTGAVKPRRGIPREGPDLDGPTLRSLLGLTPT